MKKVWKCDYCNETSPGKGVIRLHEEKCIYNPIVRHCKICRHAFFVFNTSSCGVSKNKKDITCDNWTSLE